jgi:hypothetical protein
MKTTVADLKAAFISSCARQNGLPTGRTQFQDFEIAHFLNMAYADLVYERVEALRLEMKKLTMVANTEVLSRDVACGDILMELGSLHVTLPMQTEQHDLTGAITYNEAKLWGRDTRTFEILPYNGAMPYLIAADLIQRRGIAGNAEGQGTQFYYSFPIRIFYGPEVLQHSLLLRQSNTGRLPYRIGRVRPENTAFAQNVTSRAITSVFGRFLGFFGAGGGSVDPSGGGVDRPDGLRQQMYLLEVLHKRTTNSYNDVECCMEIIGNPEVIGEEEIIREVQRPIEVGFGYKIAETAAQKAMASLSGGAQLPPQTQQRT